MIKPNVDQSVFYIMNRFEKIIYGQIYQHMENLLSELLCGFQKAHSTQHKLLRLIKK